MRKERRPYHHGNLRQTLLDAALGLLESEGAEVVSLRGVAKMAGVSHAAPAHHFGDRRGLLAALAEDGYERLHAAMRGELPEGASAVDRMRTIGGGYIAFARSRPAHFRLMFHPSLADRRDLPNLDIASRATFQLVVDTIEAGQREGSIREGVAAELALVAWSAVHGAAVLALDGQIDGNGIPLHAHLGGQITRDIYFGLAPKM